MSDPGGIMINKEHVNHVVYLKLNRYFISLTLIILSTNLSIGFI